MKDSQNRTPVFGRRKSPETAEPTPAKKQGPRTSPTTLHKPLETTERTPEPRSDPTSSGEETEEPLEPPLPLANVPKKQKKAKRPSQQTPVPVPSVLPPDGPSQSPSTMVPTEERTPQLTTLEEAGTTLPFSKGT